MRVSPGIVRLAFAWACFATSACDPNPAYELARPVGASDAAWGEQLYFELRCATCHDIRGQRRTGPPLNARFGTQVDLASGETVAFDDAYFSRSVLEPEAEQSKGYPPQMPSYHGVVKAEHLQALTAYLRQLE